MIISWMNHNDTTQWSEGLRFVQFQKNRPHHRVIDQPPYKALFGADPQIGLSSSSIPKELLPQLETEEDLEQILADAGEGDTTDVTTDDDESPPIYLRQIQIPIFPLPRHFSLHHLQLPLKSPPIVRKHQLFKY
jgi:hypothetical protein